MEYKGTLNLPQTTFPMKANLPQREPEILKFWEEMDLYRKMRENARNKPRFILHDGPPYANGHIHLGHTLNKILKDIVVRYKTMRGYDAPYVPGWDTHGLPIEQQAIKHLGVDRHKVSISEFRRICQEYALKFVNIQREEFKRLGVQGDWDHPYLTLLPEYEAVQIGIFGEMAKKGFIYKGLKPVYWCIDCETALAEAEVEYQEDESPSIFVLFPVKDSKGVFPVDDQTCILIWTTTPWTIPGNMAIAVHPDFSYALAEFDGMRVLVAEDLLPSVLRIKGIEEHRILGTWKGRQLEGIICSHPIYDRDSLVVLGEHVTLDQGTGAVHTAPAYGMDDFLVCQKYGIPVVSLVDGKGHFTTEAEIFSGASIWEGNRLVIEELQKRGRLYREAKILHQYPHCWRCKKPLIFRATEQWFASVDGFREKALEEIEKVQWIPSWGKERIHNMVAERGDWCISRQRVWGVPIPIFYCDNCNKTIISDETISWLQKLFARSGSGVWFEKTAEELLPPGFACPECGGRNFTKETDIMDVWFDSGSSHAAVCEGRPELSWPVDLYLEGSDQHRGWFNSSLCTSVATRGMAPYRAVLTHGFVVDEEGRKMSKSIGNVIDPKDLISRFGADLLRLWVSSADYRGDVAVSQNIMNQLTDAYRKIRNTFRFMLGNLYDFDPGRDSLPYDQLGSLDRWALLKLQQLLQRVGRAYESYEFHLVYHSIANFCVVDLSSFYLDITKDTLYCSAAASAERRSVQTVLYEICSVLARMLAPILSFTAEEIWGHLAGAREQFPSIHLAPWPESKSEYLDRELEDRWERILNVKDTISRALEEARKQKVIGPSTEAVVSIYPGDEAEHDLLVEAEQELARVLMVSSLKVHQVGESAPEEAWTDDGRGMMVLVVKAAGQKCNRCWLYHESVGHIPEHPDLCQRCSQVVESAGGKVNV